MRLRETALLVACVAMACSRRDLLYPGRVGDRVGAGQGGADGGAGATGAGGAGGDARATGAGGGVIDAAATDSLARAGAYA